MKRFAIIALICLMALQLSGCSHKMIQSPDTYSQIRIARLSDQGLVSIGMETARFESLMNQLADTMKKDGSCKADHAHKYLISLLTYDEVTMAVYMDEEGNLCQDGKRFTSHKKSENPIHVADWDAAFEEARLYTPIIGEGDQAGNPVVTAKNPPKPIIGTNEATDKVFFVSAKGWNYYAGNMPLEGSVSLVLWREDANGNAQRLLSMPQSDNQSQLHTIQYVNGSKEKSDEQFLFFTIKSGLTKHSSLWQFNLNNEKLGRYLNYPCGNMIFTELTMHPLQNRAWITQNQNIIAIDMSTGFIDYEASMSLRQVVSDSMFYEPESETLTKRTELTDLRNGVVGVSVMTIEKETGREVKRDQYQLNVITKRMIR